MSAGQCLPINSAISCKLSSGFVVSCFLLLLLLHLAGQSSGLRLTNMNAPRIADLREDMTLDCTFDMGEEELYAVKWYKDDHEFFRYMPRHEPKTMSFSVDGVHLVSQETSCNKTYCVVYLHQLTREHSSGAYRCEISSEAPTFRLASETHNVTVLALPRQNPRIEGLRKTCEEGDSVEVKCISDFSYPAATLSWNVGGLSVPLRDAGELKSSDPDEDGLVSRSVTLFFMVERKLSRGGSIEIRCESALPGVALPALTTTLNCSLNRTPDVEVNNQKYSHWYGGYSCASRYVQSCQIAWILFSIVLVRWSIEKLFKFSAPYQLFDHA